jgi:hypothetical protein
MVHIGGSVLYAYQHTLIPNYGLSLMFKFYAIQSDTGISSSDDVMVSDAW